MSDVRCFALARTRSRRLQFVGAVLALSIGVVVSPIASTPAGAAATFNVNSTAEGHDVNPGNGVCATSGGTCTLRAAIEESNARVGMDTVNVPAGTYTTNARLEIEDSLFLNGAGAASTFLDGADANALLHVQTVEYLVCDSTHDRVWSYDRNGERNGSFISPGSGGLDLPIAAHVGPGDDIYVTGFSSGIQRYDGDTGTALGTLVSPGSGGLVSPSDAVFGPSSSGKLLSDSLYVADFNFPAKGILRYNGQTGAFLNTFAAPGVGGLGNPNSLAFRNGDLYATSTTNSAVLRFNGTSGALVSTFVPSFSGGLSTPRDLLFAPDGSLLVASWDNDKVLRYNGTTGAFLGELVTTGSGGLDKPTDLTLGLDGSLLVTSQGTQQVLQYNINTGAFQKVLIQGGSSVFLGQPSCVVPRVGTGDGPIVNISGVTLQNGATEVGDAGSGLRTDPGSSTTLSDSRVRDNKSSTFGGGISNWGTLDIRRTEITDNELPEGGGGQTSQGGGIFNVGNLDIDRSLIANNFATRGGGISNTNQGRVDIRNSTISGNRAFGGGGGIRNVADGRFNIAFTTITANRANEPGGFGESNRFGGGIQDLSPARVSISGSIIAGNTDNRTKFDADFAPDCYAPTNFTFTSERSNLLGVLNSNCALRDVIFGDTNSDEFGNNNAPLNPLLGALTNNGGPTRTHALLPGSPAIDGKTLGTSSTFFDCQSIDQRGEARPSDGDANGTAICDIGAFERQGVPPSSGAPAHLSLSTPYWGPLAPVALSGSGFSPGETIVTTFGPTVDNTTAAADGSFNRVIAAPNVSPQTVVIKSQGQTSGKVATYYFYIGALNPWASPSSWYIHPGNTITFSGHQFAGNETVEIKVGGTVVSSATTDSSGSFVNEGSYTLPAYGGPTFTVTLRGTLSNATASIVVSAGP